MQQPDWNALQALEQHGGLESNSPFELGIRLDIGAGLPNGVQAGGFNKAETAFEFPGRRIYVFRR